MPTPSPIIGTRISVTVLKCVKRAARNNSRNAPTTAVMANSSGITVATSARNRIIRMKNPMMMPMMSLTPCVGGGFSASPVNCASIPACCPIAVSLFSRLTTPARGSWNAVRSYCTSKKAMRPLLESWWEFVASGSVIALTSLAVVSCDCSDALPAASICAMAARRCGVSSRSPAGAATTTRRAAPFWPPNFALIRFGRLLDVRPGDVEVVDQGAVKRRIQAGEGDKDDNPGRDDAPGMTRTATGPSGQAAAVGDPAFLFKALRVNEISHGRSTSLEIVA